MTVGQRKTNLKSVYSLYKECYDKIIYDSNEFFISMKGNNLISYPKKTEIVFAICCNTGSKIVV